MIRKLFSWLLTLGLTGSLYFQAAGAVASHAAQQTPAEGQPLGEGTITRLIVKLTDAFYQTAGGMESFQEGTQATSQLVARLSQAAGEGLGRDFPLTFVREMSGEAIVTALPEALPEEQAQVLLERLAALPEVEYAEPDYLRMIAVTPNDTHYARQWSLFSPGWGNYGINAPAAWDITTGSSDIVVAVIDTGITYHFDLQGRIAPGYDFISDSWTANDGGGRDSDPTDPGDWVNPGDCYSGSPAMSSSWHGTHVAGTIGAATNNAAGVAGVNWTSRILPVRVLGRCGGYVSDIADAMRWAAGLAVPGAPANPNRAQVLNLSLSGAGACSATEQSAINAVTAAGSTVVVAAGNEAVDASGYSPASCSGVITVAATERYGWLAPYSNYGTTVELSAPGGDTQYGSVLADGVLSTLNSGLRGPVADTYAYYQGTSMATPHVAGTASLLYSLIPALTPAQAAQIMQTTATAFPGGSNCNTTLCGSGIVNAGAAVSVLPRLTALSPNRAAAGSSLTLTVNGANFNSSFQILWNGVPRATTFVDSSQLTTLLTPADLASSGVYQVSVAGVHPLYGTLTTASLLFAVGLDRLTCLPLTVKSDPSLSALPNGAVFNGNFEAGASGWIAYSSSGFQIIRSGSFGSVYPLSGSYLAWLGGGDNETGYLQQAVIVNPSLPYLTYYHWISSTDWCGYDFATLSIDGFTVSSYDLCSSTSTGGWVKKSINLSSYAGKAVLLRIGIENDYSLTSSLFLDNISFSATP